MDFIVFDTFINIGNIHSKWIYEKNRRRLKRVYYSKNKKI